MKKLSTLAPILTILLLSTSSTAQFHGGIGSGFTFSKTVAATALGRNIFIGGNGDGHAIAQTPSASALGRNIFMGGNDDGFAADKTTAALLGRNIFQGGNDDGAASGKTTGALLGGNIFLGGNDDGAASGKATATALGNNIFLGGSGDGWAMAFSAHTALPMVLKDFNGQWQQHNALLKWITSAEVNTDHFELERSFDGNNFVSIAKVNAAGQTAQDKEYAYTDLAIREQLPNGTGTLYYRLKTVDKNASFSYAGVVVLKASKEDKTEYAVFPNPARDYITITAKGLPMDANTVVRIIDMQGKVLLTERMASSRQQFAVTAFASGTYFLQVVNDNKQVAYTQKIIITK